jgi:hypothetical protein
MHINFLMQIISKKNILDIHLKDSLGRRRSHRNQSKNNSHMSNKGKYLTIITSLSLLKTLGNKMSIMGVFGWVPSPWLDSWSQDGLVWLPVGGLWPGFRRPSICPWTG